MAWLSELKPRDISQVQVTLCLLHVLGGLCPGKPLFSGILSGGAVTSSCPSTCYGDLAALLVAAAVHFCPCVESWDKTSGLALRASWEKGCFFQVSAEQAWISRLREGWILTSLVPWLESVQ